MERWQWRRDIRKETEAQHKLSAYVRSCRGAPMCHLLGLPAVLQPSAWNPKKKERTRTATEPQNAGDGKENAKHGTERTSAAILKQTVSTNGTCRF